MAAGVDPSLFQIFGSKTQLGSLWHCGNAGCQEIHISTKFSRGFALNTPPAVNSQALSDIAAKNAQRISARTKRINLALISSHVVVVLSILGIVLFSYKQPVEASSAQLSSSVLEQGAASVDQIAAANVASSVAATLNMPVQDNVQNLAISLNAKTELAQTASTFITKPQIVQQSSSARRGIIKYAVAGGDSVPSVAAKFGISEDSVRWANNLTNNNLTPGTELSLPGITGTIYTVKAGDTAQTLAAKYTADADRILSYNDLEITGLLPGQIIVIPDGILPENERPGYVAVSTSYYSTSSVSVSSSRVGSFSGNGYTYGYCTWYAYNRRAELGKPIGSNWGNAATWAIYAQQDGFAVDKTPRAGDVFQQGGGYSGLGHVGVVERVNPDGSIYVSEMNYVGWNVISYRTISAAEVPSYNYIH